MRKNRFNLIENTQKTFGKNLRGFTSAAYGADDREWHEETQIELKRFQLYVCQ